MPESYDSATVEFAMTLSTLAYVDENRTATQQQMASEINAGLAEAGYKSWQVAWGPALNADRSNLAYTARSRETGQLAVSIRGSDFSFWLNWIQDLAVITLVPYDQFVPNVSSTSQIARGTAIGLRNVLRMRDGTESLQTFLSTAPEGTPILVTGHSLGGCLASALAPCVANWMGSAATISVYTIAAPSPGNAEFADYYNALFTDQSGHSTAFRFFNSLDVVPNAWASHRRDILSTAGVLPSRHYQTHCPRRNSRGGEILSAWEGCSWQRRRTIRHHHPALPCVPRSAGDQCLRECGILVGNRATTCLHDISGVATNAFDGSSSRHVEAGGCGVGDVRAPCINSTSPHCWTGLIGQL